MKYYTRLLILLMTMFAVTSSLSGLRAASKKIELKSNWTIAESVSDDYGYQLATYWKLEALEYQRISEVLEKRNTELAANQSSTRSIVIAVSAGFVGGLLLAYGGAWAWGQL